MFPPANLPVSKPCNPVKDSISLNISIIFKVTSNGFGGAGPLASLHLFFPMPTELFLAALWRFFHLSLISCVVLRATLAAFSAAAISSQTRFFLAFLTLLVNLLCKISMFSSYFLVKTEISGAVKFGLCDLLSGDAILKTMDYNVTSDFVMFLCIINYNKLA